MLACAGAFLVLLAGLSSLGLPEGPVVGLAAVLEAFAIAGSASAAYVASAFGLGGACARFWRGSTESVALQLSVGLALTLTLSHLLGVFGMLNIWFAIGVLLPGWLLSASSLLRAWRARSASWRPSPWILTWLPACAVLITAAASPPGWLWRTEAGGFDALSYHLQLSQEWLDLGQIEPREHNVYSFLPGYFEAAFTHLGAMTGASGDAGEHPVKTGLLAGTGWRVLACQYLHVWMALAAAWLARRAVVQALRFAGTVDSPTIGTADLDRRHSVAGWLAGALVLSTPWTVVTGSMAYNEMPMLALGIGAIIVSFDRGMAPVRRVMIAAVLVGAACGVKPTALLMLAPPVALAIFASTPRRDWLRIGVVGGLVGTAMLAPWMIRNALSCGNPVFPHLTGFFGTGHWTSEQVARYSAGHFFDGGPLERLQMLMWPIGDESRGITHTQWGVWSVALLIAAALIRTRRIAMLLAIGVALQVLAWMMFTHLQSRFLIPVLACGGVLVGVTAGQAKRVWPLAALGLMLMVQVSLSVLTFARQGNDDEGPNARLLQGVHGMTGLAYLESLASLPEVEQQQILRDASDAATINLGLDQGELVYLLGDSTPLFCRWPVLYHTTWDTSLLGQLVRAHPDDPKAWTQGLRDQGVRFVLINRAELARLHDAGWYDPVATLDVVDRWAAVAGEPLRKWPREAIEPMKILIELRP